uniref:NAD(P)-bd_dom domain-containing protein n=1 Tax=Rhabditophanes sp. KR3021 TaxID=114890 RepID=A0AC35TR77_9BILA
MNAILVTGGLGYLGSNFVNHLTITKAFNDSKIVILDKVSEQSDLNRINDQDRVVVVIGNISNEPLVKSLLDTHNIDTIFNFAFDTCIEDAFLNPIENCRNNFEGLTHLLDAIRHSPTKDQINFIHCSSEDVYGSTTSPCLESSPIYPNDPVGAAHGSCEMMLNAYAKGYALDIKIARLPSHIYGGLMPSSNLVSSIIQTKCVPQPNHILSPMYILDAIKGLLAVAGTEKKTAEVFNLPAAYSLTEENLKEFGSGRVFEKVPSKMGLEKVFMESNWVPVVTLEEGMKEVLGRKDVLKRDVKQNPRKFLIYGGKGWIGEQFCELLKGRGIEFEVGKSRPGTDRDEVVLGEIVAVAPSNVISMVGRTQGPGCGNISYLEGGPDKLNENMRDNCFAPWILAKICQGVAIHFTYLGTGCIFQFDQTHSFTGPGYTEHDNGNFNGTSYSAVKMFTDRAFRYLPQALNARIRLPVNFENGPRNLAAKMIAFNKVLDIPNSITILPDCLPILLEMALNKEVGTINLVNPGPVKFTDFKVIWAEVSGKEDKYEVLDPKGNPEMVNTRAHCILDTSKILSKKGDLRNAAEGIREAYQKIVQEQNVC